MAKRREAEAEDHLKKLGVKRGKVWIQQIALHAMQLGTLKSWKEASIERSSIIVNTPYACLYKQTTLYLMCMSRRPLVL